MKQRRCILALVALVAAASAARPAGAQPAASAVAAEELFRKGRELIEQGRFAEACEKLEASEKLDAAVGTLFSLGECYAGQGRTASAWFAFRGAASLAAARNDHRRVGAQMKADALEPELAHLTIKLSDRRDQVRVLVDGAPIDAAALDSPIPVDRGKHHVEARGASTYEVDVDIPNNGIAAQVVIPSLVPPPPPPVWHAAPEWKRDLGMGLTGVGAMTAVVGAVFGVQAMVKARDVRAQCGDQPTCGSADAVHQHDLGGTYADLATVLIPAGLAAAGVGIYVLATTHGSFEPAVTPAVGPGEARLDARWVW